MKAGYKIVFVINEMSRGGSTREKLKENLYKLVEMFQSETEQRAAILFSRNREHIGKSVGSMQAQGYNVFVTYGGDGTINDTIQNLNEGSYLIPIPAGNANDFAGRLQMRGIDDTIESFKDILEILIDLVNDRINTIGLDVGEVYFANEKGEKKRKRFINNMGFGGTADTVKRIDGMVKKNYALAGFLAILEAKGFPVQYSTLLMDKAETIRCIGIEALLCRKVGNFAYLAPYKRENNETMHFYVIPELPLLKKLIFIGLLRFSTIAATVGLGNYFHDRKFSGERNPLSMTLEGVSSLSLKFEQTLPLHVDGNLVPEFETTIQKECGIRILPKFLRTIAPC